MKWETIIYSLLLILVSINAFVFFAENYVYTGVDETGTPVKFSFDNTGNGSTYSYEDLEDLHEETNPDLSDLVQDTAPDNIWAIASSGFASFWAVLQQFYNLTFGYQRLFLAMFSPLNTATDCATTPIQDGCIGTGIATLFNTIIIIPIIIGIIYFIKFILQTVGISK